MASAHAPKGFCGALSKAARGDAGSLCRGADTGETWQRVDHDIEINSTVMSITVSSDNPDRVYFAARMGQVFGTEDGGKSWDAMPMPKGVVDLRAIACA